MSVAIVGAGRVGSALASLLVARGSHVDLWSRRPPAVAGARCWSGDEPPGVFAEADLIIVAVSDRAVTAVAKKLRPLSLREGACVVHTSGAHGGAALLAPLTGVAHLGTLHPLVAIRSAEQGVEVMPGAYWVLEGHDIAVGVCAKVVEELGARWERMAAEDMALYHALAVIASNHAVALWSAAADTLRRLGGLGPRRAAEMIEPLLASTLDNVRVVGLPEALTGPVRRGDIVTIREHLRAIRGRAPELLASYRADASLAAKIMTRREGGTMFSGRNLAKLITTLDAIDLPEGHEGGLDDER